MNAIDTLRYQLADALYRGEGRYGTLELDVRYLDDEHGEDPGAWLQPLGLVRLEAQQLLDDEHDDGRRAGLTESLQLLGRLVDEIGALDAQEAA